MARATEGAAAMQSTLPPLRRSTESSLVARRPRDATVREYQALFSVAIAPTARYRRAAAVARALIAFAYR